MDIKELLKREAGGDIEELLQRYAAGERNFVDIDLSHRWIQLLKNMVLQHLVCLTNILNAN